MRFACEAAAGMICGLFFAFCHEKCPPCTHRHAGNKTNFDVVKMVKLPRAPRPSYGAFNTLSQDGMHAMTAFLLFWTITHTSMQR